MIQTLNQTERPPKFQINEGKKIGIMLEIEILGKGNVIGLEDLVGGFSSHTISVQVLSQKSEFFRIEKGKFKKEVSREEKINDHF